MTSSVAKDLNPTFDATCPGAALSQMRDHDDWGTLGYTGVLSYLSAAASKGHKALICYDDPASVAKRTPVRWLGP